MSDTSGLAAANIFSNLEILSEDELKSVSLHLEKINQARVQREREQNVNRFWSKYERVVSSFDELSKLIHDISTQAANSQRNLVWRGQAKSGWGLNSGLSRKLYSEACPLNEDTIASHEKNTLIELRKWGLHQPLKGGSLPILSQLAVLQHYGTPTRLIDVSYNALIALFFAVEDESIEDDARLYAIDITRNQVNDSSKIRSWSESLDTPWSKSFVIKEFNSSMTGSEFTRVFEESLARKNLLSQLKEKYEDISQWERFSELEYLVKVLEDLRLSMFQRWKNQEWMLNLYSWRPPALDSRISAQNGGFIFGGHLPNKSELSAFKDLDMLPYLDVVVSERIKSNPLYSEFIKETDVLNDILEIIDEIASLGIASLAIMPRKICIDSKAEHTDPQLKKKYDLYGDIFSSVYSIRIKSNVKVEARRILNDVYGYNLSTIFPDYAGFQLHSTRKSFS